MSQSSTTHTTPTAQNSSALGGFGHALKTQYEVVSSWEDANYSAKVIGCVNLAFVLLWTLNLAPITTVLYLASISIACGLPLSRFMRWSAADDTKVEFISKQQITEIAEFLHLRIEQAGKLNIITRSTMISSLILTANEIRYIFYWTDFRRSAIIAAGLFAAGWLMSIVSLGTLIFLGESYPIATDALFIIVYPVLNGAVLRKPVVALYHKHAAKHVQPLVDKIFDQVNVVLCKAQTAYNPSHATKSKKV